MADNRERGKKAAATAKERHGEDFHAKIGQKGGKEHTPNIEASKKGGEHSHGGGRHKKDEGTR